MSFYRSILSFGLVLCMASEVVHANSGGYLGIGYAKMETSGRSLNLGYRFSKMYEATYKYGKLSKGSSEDTRFSYLGINIMLKDRPSYIAPYFTFGLYRTKRICESEYYGSDYIAIVEEKDENNGFGLGVGAYFSNPSSGKGIFGSVDAISRFDEFVESPYLSCSIGFRF